ncbi:MAG: PEP-CTERM sorting domain-containing protein [Verrucomicrobiota bacterium JB023]|nr:PEP-CTERM sorting domain-containing protein [Verrucomicrobiota bacterium JB023]
MFKTQNLMLGALLVGASVGHSAVLASYEFDNTGSTNDSESANSAWFAATTVDPNVVGGGFTSGSGVDPLVIANTDVLFAAEGQGMSDGTTADLAGAIVDGDYFGVTIAAAPGYTLDLDNVTFNVGRANNGTRDYAFFTSVGGFSVGDQVVYAENAITADSINSTQTIDLSGASYEGLTSIEFRIVFDRRVNNSGYSSATFIDNFTVNGAAIPEPSSAALLCLGAFALVRRRR